MEPEVQASKSPPAGADLVLGISGLVILIGFIYGLLFIGFELHKLVS